MNKTNLTIYQEKISYLEEDDGMIARGLHEQLVEIRGGRRQHHLVALYGTSVAGQRDVTKCLRAQMKM